MERRRTERYPISVRLRHLIESAKITEGGTVEQTSPVGGEDEVESFGICDRQRLNILLDPGEALAIKFLLEDAAPWHRLWVMQEPSFAPDIQLVVGRHTLDWDVLIRIVEDTPSLDAFHYVQHEQLAKFCDPSVITTTINFVRVGRTVEHQRRIIKDVRAGKVESKLLDVLAHFRHIKASNLRDKIFGSPGLTTDGPDIEVDYILTVEDVHAGVAASIINHVENLDIVCESPWRSINEGKIDTPPDEDKQFRGLPS